MSIADKLYTLQTIKANIKTAIENKGVDVGDAPFTDYASKIDGIEGGSSDGGETTILKLSEQSQLNFSSFNIQGKLKIECAANTEYIMFYNATFSNPNGIEILNSNSLDSTYNMYKLSNIVEPYLFDTSNVTDMSSMFYGCSKLQAIPQFITSNVTDMSTMFYECTNLETIPQLDTSNVSYMSSMFYGCSKLQAIPQLDTSNVSYMSYMFWGCSKLTNIGGFQGLKVNIDLKHSSLITRESMLNIFNTMGEANSIITIHQNVADRLTDEDKAIATNKGWRISIG